MRTTIDWSMNCMENGYDNFLFYIRINFVLGLNNNILQSFKPFKSLEEKISFFYIIFNKFC